MRKKICYPTEHFPVGPKLLPPGTVVEFHHAGTHIDFWKLTEDVGKFKKGEVLPISEEALESIHADVEISEQK